MVTCNNSHPRRILSLLHLIKSPQKLRNNEKHAYLLPYSFHPKHSKFTILQILLLPELFHQLILLERFLGNFVRTAGKRRNVCIKSHPLQDNHCVGGAEGRNILQGPCSRVGPALLTLSTANCPGSTQFDVTDWGQEPG